MIKGILCSTNSTEPWAARVEFEFIDGMFVTTLKKSYAHYKNLLINNSAVILFTNKDLEIIIKSSCTLDDIDEKYCKATFEISWARIVTPEDTSDYSNSQEIKDVVTKFIF